MSELKRVKLGEISDMCLGKMLNKETNKGELQPYLANVNVRWGSFDLSDLNLMRFEKSEQDRYGLRFGDIVMCEGGEPGRCAIWKEELPDMKIQKALHRIRIRGDYSTQFVYYRFLLAGRSGELEKYFIGSTIKHLTGISLKQVEFAYPSLNEQEKIASVLSALDAKIELNQRINTELESMAKTLYDYWFVQFDFPNEQGKPYKSSGGKMVWNEELKREIPAEWEVSELRKYVSFKRGISYTGKALTGDGVPMINLNSFNSDSTYKPEGIKSFSENYDSAKILKPFDLVMCNTQQTDLDPEKDIIGKSFLIPDIFKSDIVSSHHVTTITVNKEMLKYYLNSLFNTNYFHRYISGYATGTNILSLNFEGVASFQAALPSDDLLISYKLLVVNIEKQKCRIIKENQCLTELRDWLLPMLMNGQVKVDSQD